jgi:hypothetical protein
MKERCLNKKFLYVYLEFYIYTHIILIAHAREFRYFTSPQYSLSWETMQ